MQVVSTVIEAQGGVREVGNRINIASETLSEILSGEEAPRVDIFANILSALGCKLAIQPTKDDDVSTDIKLTVEKGYQTIEDMQTQTQLTESDST